MMNFPQDQAALEKAKARMFLEDFLSENPMVTPDGQAYDPQSQDWSIPVAAVMGNQPVYRRQPPVPITNPTEHILPDFFDDMITEYFRRQSAAKTGGS